MSLAPAIRNYQSQPPNGGWGIDFELGGQHWWVKASPYKMVEKIAGIQKANGKFDGYAPIWDMLNQIWTNNDPKRALPYADSKGTRHLPQNIIARKVVLSPRRKCPRC